MTRFVIGLTGASGVIYGIKLAEELLKRDFEVHMVASRPACLVIEEELGWDFTRPAEEVFREKLIGRLLYHDNDNIAAPIASGSYRCSGMVVIPCTMATASAIATGSSRSLLERCADVMLKERVPLLVVPRETPLSPVHLRNLLTLAEMGVHVIPAMPAFYSHPQTIEDMVDFVVGKVLDAMHVEHELFPRYQG
ncbi:MAG TPA: flavin prenyltransferase UbiX [Syntrophomonadaceae bacterium]|nr:flavin prenyltransferase UbiX [Syntrophomonadaceae bacterium]